MRQGKRMIVLKRSGIMRRGVALLVAGAALAGCVSVLPEPDAPNALYQIQAGSSQGLELAADIVIREPETVRVFAGQSIVAEAPDGGLRLVPGVEWAGPSTQIMQLALLEALNRSNGEGIAVTPGAGSRAPYELDWRISDLSLRSGRAMCSLQLILLDGATRDPLAKLDIREQTEITSDDAEDRALALSQAAQKAIEEAARQISERLKG